jgi:HEAT repeat protein
LKQVNDLTKGDNKKRPRFPEESIRECLRILEDGSLEDLFEIIPRVGVLRDGRFVGPLRLLLAGNDIKKREFAAYAMGAMGERHFLGPLKDAFLKARGLRGAEAEDLMVAVIEAIGALGDDAAVEFFLPVLLGEAAERVSGKLSRWIVESLGAVAQQGGERATDALVQLTRHPDSDLRSHAITELSVAYWHRPNEIPDSTLSRIHDLTRDRSRSVAESAISALQGLADVGCRRAEELFEQS